MSTHQQSTRPANDANQSPSLGGVRGGSPANDANQSPTLKEVCGCSPANGANQSPSFGGVRGGLIIFSAPSGSGKSTIINRLMRHEELRMAFSISCTSRPPRGTERDGVEYFFITPDEFRRRIAAGEFLEYEEVYAGRFYGTLKQQVEKQLERGENVVFDVDVKGGCNIKQYYGSRALSIFIQPPSVEALRQRLTSRGTDAPEVIEQRLERAAFELSFAGRYDRVIVNDDLETAEQEALQAVRDFLRSTGAAAGHKP